MCSAIETEIREHAGSYIRGDLSLDEFTDWFMPVMWSAEEGADPDLAALAGEIDLWLIEHGNGHRTEEDLKSCLASVVVPLHGVHASPRTSVVAQEG